MSPFQHGEVFVTADGTETDLDLGALRAFCAHDHRPQQAISRRAESMSASLRRSGAAIISVRRCRSFRTSPTRSSTGFAWAPAIRTSAWWKSAARSATSNRCRFSKHSPKWAWNSARQGAVHAPDLGADLRRRRRNQDQAHPALGEGAARHRHSPDILLCRCSQSLPDEQRPQNCVVHQCRREGGDFRRWIPMTSTKFRCCCTSGPGRHRGRQAALNAPSTDLSEWRAVVAAKQNPEAVVDIGMVGKYVQIRDSYISLNESLMHGGIKTRTRSIFTISSRRTIERSGAAALQKMDAILVRRIRRPRHRRQDPSDPFCARNGIPYLGICLGMQLAIIEYARNVLASRAPTAPSPHAPTNSPVIALITEWQAPGARQQVADEKSDLGGT